MLESPNILHPSIIVIDAADDSSVSSRTEPGKHHCCQPGNQLYRPV